MGVYFFIKWSDWVAFEKGRPFQIEDTHYKLFPIKCMSLFDSELVKQLLILDDLF